MIDIARRLTTQIVAMGMEGPVFSASRQEDPSVKQGVFYNELINKLKAHEEGRAGRFVIESWKLARNTLFIVLSNIACRHLDLNNVDGFRKPPVGADVLPAKEKATPLEGPFHPNGSARLPGPSLNYLCHRVVLKQNMMHVPYLDTVLFMLPWN